MSNHQRTKQILPVTRNILLTFIYLTCIASCTAVSDKTQTRTKPNIVFILIDDMGMMDSEVYGHEFHETPHINQLAKEGIVFTNAYAASPVCSSTRASIQSGQYPARVGITDFIPGFWRPYEKLRVPYNRTHYLPLEVTTIGEAMQQAGYHTGYIGKWHLNRSLDFLPKAQGYDETRTRLRGKHFDFSADFHPPFNNLNQDDYLTDVLTDEALSFIERNKDKPFFLTLSHYAVHIPLQAKQEIIEKYEQKPKPDHGVNNPIYAAMVEHVDDSVGRINAQLKQLGLEENTVIVFYSDNGGLIKTYTGDGPEILTNAPLRSEKGSLYEGGTRVPFIVKWPSNIKAGSKTDTMMSSPDLFPTFIEMAGAQLPEAQTFDGISLVSALKNPQYQERTLYFHYPHYHHSSPAGAIREGDFKLIQFYDDMRVELYNLKDDISEDNNLAAIDTDKAKYLQEKLEKWRVELNASMPIENPDYDPKRRLEWGRNPGFSR